MNTAVWILGRKVWDSEGRRQAGNYKIYTFWLESKNFKLFFFFHKFLFSHSNLNENYVFYLYRFWVEKQF